MLMLKKGFYYFMKEESLEFESKLDKNDCKLLFKEYSYLRYLEYLINFLIVYYGIKLGYYFINKMAINNMDILYFVSYIFIRLIFYKMFQLKKRFKVVGTKIYLNNKLRNYSKVIISKDFFFIIIGRRRGVVKIPNGKKNEIIDFFDLNKVVYEVVDKPFKIERKI